MLGALESAGFKEIKVLGDLEPIPTNALSDECDFYTYVAVK
jgi:hypothetical protein